MSKIIYFLSLSVLWMTLWSGSFWYFENRRIRGPLLRRLSVTQRMLLPFGFSGVLWCYCLSYAPFLSLLEMLPGLRSELVALDDLFVPVQWLVDHTALRKPLIFWAGLWGVPREVVESASAMRMRNTWGTTAPWLFVCGWILIGTTWAVLPPYLLCRFLNFRRTWRSVKARETETDS